MRALLARGKIVFFAALLGLMLSAPAGAQTRQAFRLTTLALRDPHIFYDLLAPGVCTDLTPIVNNFIQSFVNECTPVTPGVPEPCNLELNLVAVFNPLVPAPPASAPLAPCMFQGAPCDLQVAVFPTCTRTGTRVACQSTPSTVVPTTYNLAGSGMTCLGAIAGTTGANNNPSTPYTPPIGTTQGPCAASNVLELTFEFGDNPRIEIPLKGAQIAAQYMGNPPTSLVNGLARGFLSEQVAREIMLNVELTPGQPAISSNLAGLLKGGGGRCSGGADDRDFNPPHDMNGERGWWFYLAFTASPVEVPEIVIPTPTATVGMPTPTPRPPCPGDCNGDRTVRIEEVQTAASVFLRRLPLSSCPAADVDGSGDVLIYELQRAANAFRLGCP